MIEILFSLGSANTKNSYTVTSAMEGEKHYIALNIDEKYIVATSKSNTGKKQIQKWWDEYRADKYKTSEQADLLLKLISNSKYFDLLVTPIDAYKEYLRISNGKSFLSKLFCGENPNGLFPKKSFQLMTEWYTGALESKYEEYSKNSLDEFNEDVKQEIEKRLISELIKEIKEKYTEPKKIEGLRPIAPHLGSNTKSENDLIPIKRFVDWLEQKQKNISQTKEIENTPLLDLSDTSAVDKLIYLKELGIINFLKTIPPFNTSTNKLAEIISAITGENVTTIQPPLNAHLSTGVDKQKDFYKSTKAVNKVRNKLIEKGFQVK